MSMSQYVLDIQVDIASEVDVLCILWEVVQPY